MLASEILFRLGSELRSLLYLMAFRCKLFSSRSCIDLIEELAGRNHGLRGETSVLQSESEVQD